MAQCLLILALWVVNATASAHAGQSRHLSVMTDNAEAAAKAAEHRVAQLTAQCVELAQRYQGELDAIDRLKRQRTSWRHDRELRDSLSSSADTANQLGATTFELEKASARLASARRAYLAAIEAERNAGVDARRARQLDRARRALGAQLAQVKDPPHRILFPDLDVDPLADPEELDQRAIELRASEDALNRQLTGLAARAAELERLAFVRKQDERAGYLLDRDDDPPHFTSSILEDSVPIVLSEVLDASAIDLFAEAQRSGDPAQRAAAAHQARAAVAKRLDQVRQKRSEIEARARQLRRQR